MDDANAGSADAGTPDAAQSAAATGSAAAAETTPFSGLQDADTRAWVEKIGLKSVDDLAKKAFEQEKLIGSSLRVPGDDAKPEDWGSFYAKLGRPEKPDGYELKRPEGLPAELPYDEGLAKSFKGFAHEAGLNPKQAQLLHDRYATWQADQAKAALAEASKAVESAHDDLIKSWGPKDSEPFKKNLALADRALDKLGLKDSMHKLGAILPDGALTDAAFAKALAVVGERMFAEDQIDGSTSSGSGPNPFKAETRNISEINRLAASDPDRARQLAKEAGVNPDDWLGRKRPARR